MKLYGLIGWPLGHSFSASYFNNRFKLNGTDAQYKTYPIEHISKIRDIIDIETDLVGFNVTAPYKQQIIPFMDNLTDEAQQASAVNTVKIERSTDRKGKNSYRLYGHNTDIAGFRESIRPLLRNDITQALILGTGGAANAVAEGLKQLNISPTFVSRSVNRQNIISYNDLSEEIISSHLIIINATPLGTWPNCNSAPDIPYNFLTPYHICHDLVYNPADTLFMQHARRSGAIVKNGYDMLINQAELAYSFWNSLRPS